ncbi:hypothetical protein C7S18_19735 [Ahniella affigens]|uniref:Uncharacterized protein n=1 Tax=Ahniella affigens TaxID=2021234 RepID=A0A2P1PWM8_9GAMM|nr:hypothetical protein [Ahniella affigens]AVP99258.1 hypothetical protein C7S18_19735 [Ahniella affigens]
MLSQIRHRFAGLTRAWALLLTLALSWQPMLPMLTDLHASTHSASGNHVDHRDHVDGRSAPGNPEERDFLHRLMHAAICCVHLTALPASTNFAFPKLSASPLPRAPSHLFESVLQARLLRPPIAG